MNWSVIVLYTPITITPTEFFNMNACWSNQYLQLIQFLKTGLFFSNELFKEPFIWHSLIFFLNPADHIRFFSVLLESNIDTGYIHRWLTPFQLKTFQLKLSQYVCYIIWERRCTKMIVGRLLKVTVSYIRIDKSYGTQILSPNVLEQGLWNDFIFWIM